MVRVRTEVAGLRFTEPFTIRGQAQSNSQKALGGWYPSVYAVSNKKRRLYYYTTGKRSFLREIETLRKNRTISENV
jgi:hypothetical protein